MTIEEVYIYINVNPGKGRKSVFWNTTITPEHILQDFAKGMTDEQILKQHPQLTNKHLDAAFVYSKEFPTDSEMLVIALTGLVRNM